MGTLRLGSSVVVPSVTVNTSTPPVIQSLSVTPSTSSQTITAPSGVDGYSPISVDAVDNTIDSNITANNIKSGITILGVTGNVVELNGEQINITPTTSQQIITPTSPKNGITQATVSAVTSSIDANITAGNIKKDVSILGVTGTYEGSGGTLITKTITENGTYNAQDDNADGYSQVTVNVSGSGRLPDGYTELKYITGDGDAYLDLGLTLNQNDEVEVEFTMPQSSITTKNIFGYRDSANLNAFTMMIASSADSFVADFNDSNYSPYRLSTTLSPLNTFNAVISKTGRYLYQGSTLIASNTTLCSDIFTTPGNALLFNIGGTPAYQNKFIGSISKCVVLGKRSLIPARRNSDSVLGMYDLVSNAFFTNANNIGAFTAGPVVDPGGIIPSGTLPITQNGTYNVTDYAYANVNVSGGASSVSVAKSTSNDKLTNGGVISIINLTGITDIGDYVLCYAYYNGYSLSGKVDFSDLTTISGNYACQNAFKNCSNIEEVDLSSLQSIIGQYACQDMFSNCDKIETIDLSNLTTVSGYGACQNMFDGCDSIVSINLSNLTTISNTTGCQNMFHGCTSLTSVDLSGLTNIDINYSCSGMFNGCSSLTNVDISSVTTINGYQGAYTMFAGTNIASIDLSNLTAIDGAQACYGMFSSCTHLSSVNLSSLSSITGMFSCLQMFSGCTSLNSLSFPALTSTSFGSYTNQFNNMLSGVTGCTVHFPSNLQSVIGSWASVQAGFSGTNTTVLFDLPATE